MPLIDAAIQDRIAAIAGRGEFSHAYIFAGGSSMAAGKAALEFAKALLCGGQGRKPCGQCLSCRKAEHGTHEDILFLRREKNSIGVKQVLGLLERLRNKPYAADMMIAIIEEADRMTVQSQNKLLKTLEEPNPGHIIILAPENQEMLLPTIRSRCAVFRLAGIPGEGEGEGWAAELAKSFMESKAYYEMGKLLDGAVTDKEKAYAALDAMEALCRGHYLRVGTLPGWQAQGLGAAGGLPYVHFVDLIEAARRDLNSDVSYKYALRNLAAQKLSCMEGAAWQPGF
ncbi:MAG: hypothetical protein LBH39_03285 [Clostridiales Family XIII bacterium]|nr:hypothetical protein [Clostridiales Family XIII bacterium]